MMCAGCKAKIPPNSSVSPRTGKSSFGTRGNKIVAFLPIFRYLNEPPKEAYNLQLPQDKMEQFSSAPNSNYAGLLGGEVLDYDPIYSPQKFLVGTEQGVIISCQRRKNKPIQIEKAYFGHVSPIYAVQRNPYNPKYFLSIGDWTVKIWHEEFSAPIISTKYHNTYLTDGCWSASRPSVLYTTKTDGTMDVWDLAYKQNKPILSVGISDVELHCLKCKDGKYLSVGAVDGSVSLVELSDSLSGFAGEEKQPVTEEKNQLSAILDRETKREKNLIENKKLQAQKKKNNSDAAAAAAPSNVNSNTYKIDEAELVDVVETFCAQTQQE